MSDTRPINDIIVGDNRFRKDLGEIAALAESITAIGLLHPITVDQHNNLLAGQRRLEACKFLGLTEIAVCEVRV
jgi:ParB family chromosome partitioning protein